MSTSMILGPTRAADTHRGLMELVGQTPLYTLVGPPGTGKTTRLASLVEQAVGRGWQVLIASLTKTAAREVVRRNLPIHDHRIGTLHAHAYRALGGAEIAEGKDGLKSWAEWVHDRGLHIGWELSGGRPPSPDEPKDGEVGADGDERTEGDDLYEQIGVLRSRLVPEDAWPVSLRAFFTAWCAWKAEHGFTDFEDLIERCALEDIPPAVDVDALYVDEAQDLSASEIRLCATWARRVRAFVVVGDPRQCLYEWRGSSPTLFGELIRASKKSDVLRQSYRVPRAVHAEAVAWVAQLQDGIDAEYLPKDVDGSVARHGAPSLRHPDWILDDAQEAIDRGESTMFLTSCSYMLRPLIAVLRSRGIPFHNPYRCSPPDEPVLTTDGWVAISELDPSKHRLAGFYSWNNALSWGGRSGPKATAESRGFTFDVESQDYDGDLLTIETTASKTRVTPNHRVRVRYADTFYDKWVVYLMRRGNWWRVGQCRSGSIPFINGGVGGRLTTELADDAWILEVHSTKRDAVLAEAAIHARYGITGLTFRASPTIRRINLDSDALYAFHEAQSDVSGERAMRLLRERGLDPEWPLFRRNSRQRRTGFAFETVAANLIPLSGYLSMPLAPDDFLSPASSRMPPRWETLTVTSEHYRGMVYSLDVPGPEHYISGGAVVHNSTRGDWNPLARPSSPTSSAGRLVAFSRTNTDVWGDEARFWTAKELHGWTDALPADLFTRGGKTAIKRAAEKDGVPLDLDGLAALVPSQEMLRAMLFGDLAWYRERLAPKAAKGSTFALAVADRLGVPALLKEPKAIVGTCHSVKGGEASRVYLWPDLSPSGYDDWCNRDTTGQIVRLAYVGMTRAEHHLIMGQASSLRAMTW